MSHIPAELVEEILSRLPVKALVRFKSVSKPWLHLIDSPNFINSHLNNSTQSKSNLTLLVRTTGPKLYSLELDSPHNLTQLNIPCGCQKFLGSCNGLLCLQNFDKDIFLINPSTRALHKLPLTRIDFPDTNSILTYEDTVYGFGYDHVNDDYKVVRITQFWDFDETHTYDSQVKVYSLKSNSWRTIQDFPYGPCDKRHNGLFFNGALHWVVIPSELDDRHMIVAFDLGTEEYRLVPPPDDSRTFFRLDVNVLGGCLCAYRNGLIEVDIWVMKEYGIRESWTKLISGEDLDLYIPIGDQVLLQMHNQSFSWYDLKKKKVNNCGLEGLPLFFNSNIWLESLVKLPYMKRDWGWRRKRKIVLKKNKKFPKKRNRRQ